LEDQPLDERLEAKDLLDPDGRKGTELIEGIGRVRAIARVDQPRPEVRPLNDLARQPLDSTSPARCVDCVGLRLAVQDLGELDHRPAVEDGRRDVVSRDLWVVRLGQVDAERVVVQRLLSKERVAVVVDDRDRAEIERHGWGVDQYLKKCWSSSKASSFSAYAAASASRTLRYSVARPLP